jgi:hypothetical protein
MQIQSGRTVPLSRTKKQFSKDLLQLICFTCFAYGIIKVFYQPINIFVKRLLHVPKSAMVYSLYLYLFVYTIVPCGNTCSKELEHYLEQFYKNLLYVNFIMMMMVQFHSTVDLSKPNIQLFFTNPGTQLVSPWLMYSKLFL